MRLKLNVAAIYIVCSVSTMLHTETDTKTDKKWFMKDYVEVFTLQRDR